MTFDRDPNELARMLERVAEADFIRVIVRGHLKFRHPECRCDICQGKFQELAQTPQRRGAMSDRQQEA